MGILCEISQMVAEKLTETAELILALVLGTEVESLGGDSLNYK